MSSQTYRYYRLDAVGHLNLGEWFEAENDERAIALIGQIQTGARCEVWQGERLLARLSPDCTPTVSAQSIGEFGDRREPMSATVLSRPQPEVRDVQR